MRAATLTAVNQPLEILDITVDTNHEQLNLVRMVIELIVLRLEPLGLGCLGRRVELGLGLGRRLGLGWVL